MRLLQHIDFHPEEDQLWLVGDLVNRGPQSLEVLRFLRTLPKAPYITLGNHDLHLLCQIFLPSKPKPDDTLTDILNTPDKEEIGHWLRHQSVLHYDKQLNCVMTHAGIAPSWTLPEAKSYASELENALRSEDYRTFLTHMYGNTPCMLAENLTPLERLRVICNVFTRMRFCNQAAHLELSIKTKPQNAPPQYYPWYAHPDRKTIPADLVFGHWAALEGRCTTPRVHAIDTGCVWGGSLTAFRLHDKQRFSVPAFK